MARLAAVIALAACGSPARLIEPAARPAPFCFAVEALHFGSLHYSRACTDSADLCSYARDRAIAFAGLAGFVAVGRCGVEAQP